MLEKSRLGSHPNRVSNLLDTCILQVNVQRELHRSKDQKISAVILKGFVLAVNGIRTETGFCFCLFKNQFAYQI